MDPVLKTGWKSTLGSRNRRIHCGLAAAAAKSLQSCPTLCNPSGSPSGSPVPGILQARTRECVAISFSNAWKWKVKVKSLSRVRLLATPRTAAHQGSSVHGIFQARVLEWGAIAFSDCGLRFYLYSPILLNCRALSFGNYCTFLLLINKVNCDPHLAPCIYWFQHRREEGWVTNTPNTKCRNQTASYSQRKLFPLWHVIKNKFIHFS